MHNPLCSLAGVLAFSLALVPLVACSTSAAGRRADSAPDSLTVRELTIVDEQGTPRVRIGAPLPDLKGLKRAVQVVGLQFMDPAGKEVGGLVMIDSLDIRGLCFDHEKGYEAMCMGLIKGQPGVTFRDDFKDRITLGVENGVATVVLSDGQGRPTLRLEVDRDGRTRVEGVTATPGGKPAEAPAGKPAGAPAGKPAEPPAGR